MNRNIVAKLISEGELKKGSVIEFNPDAESYFVFRCTISSMIVIGSNTILKLRTGKDYPFGHKYIFRGIDEIA